MKISVVICSREGIPDKLVNSLKKQTLQPDEIISIQGNALTKQRNEGVEKATGDLITFFDDDIELEPNYLEEIAKTFYLYPEAMAVTGNITAKAFSPNILHTIFAHLFILSRRGKGRFLISGFPEIYAKDILEITKAEVLHWCSMTIRKEAFDDVQFNENLEGGMYGEDDWFSYQLSRKYAVYYTPFAVCYDDRDYPHGKQEWKTRCSIKNLVARYYERKCNLIGSIAFWWSMLGFIILKAIEAVIMRDWSILRGIYAGIRRRVE